MHKAFEPLLLRVEWISEARWSTRRKYLSALANPSSQSELGRISFIELFIEEVYDQSICLSLDIGLIPDSEYSRSVAANVAIRLSRECYRIHEELAILGDSHLNKDDTLGIYTGKLNRKAAEVLLAEVPAIQRLNEECRKVDANRRVATVRYHQEVMKSFS
jgi:hypothetical protein